MLVVRSSRFLKQSCCKTVHFYHHQVTLVAKGSAFSVHPQLASGASLRQLHPLQQRLESGMTAQVAEEK